jgi:glycosyltransferase involved in cell wall biosynthesis
MQNATPINPSPRPAVTVVVPAYKIADEIDQCLQSLAAQTLPSLEVLVINDGSPDDTAAKARVWEAKFPGRIFVIDKVNGGCASSRAEGLRRASGDYVAFVDGDDWVDPSMFEALYNAAEAHGADIAQCSYLEVFADGRRIPPQESVRLGNQTAEGYYLVTKPVELLPLRPSIWRRIYRRDFLLENNIAFPEHIRRFDDLPFQFETFVCAERVVVLPNFYYFYRQDRPGQDINIRDDRFFVHFELFDWLDQWLSGRKTLEIEKQFYRAELNSHFWALSRIEESYKPRYYARALRHLNRPRALMTFWDKIETGRSLGNQAFRFVLRSLASPFMQWGKNPSAMKDLSPKSSSPV